MQVAHDASEFQDGEERILVLKDSGILGMCDLSNVTSTYRSLFY